MIIKNLKILFLLFLLIPSCSEKNNIKKDNELKYNFIMTISDSEVENPENDRRSYYEVTIDKTESGRTTIALESQKKIFETRLSPDKHLVKIEKWILDDSQGRYIKLNNIYQPKPNFVYINIENKKTIKLTVQSSKSGTTLYTTTAE